MVVMYIKAKYLLHLGGLLVVMFGLLVLSLIREIMYSIMYSNKIHHSYFDMVELAKAHPK